MRKFGKPDENGYYDSWEFNPYYHPESCDVELIQVISEPNLSYEFNHKIIIKDNPTGDIFMAQDSGCSCPTPFENIHGLADMIPVRNMRDFDEFFNRDSYRTSAYIPSDVLKARRKLAEFVPDYC